MATTRPMDLARFAATTVSDFLVESINGERAKWRENTRTKVAGNLLSALRDFGLLTGVQRKKLQRPGAWLNWNLVTNLLATT
jgi:hypothetical protein